MIESKQEINAFFRVLNTDLNGHKPIAHALLKVNGISYAMANSICNLLKLDKNKKAGLFTDVDAKKIEQFVTNPNNFPKWMLNRRLDPETGENKHIIGSDLKFTKELDIKKLKKLKTYRGMRHSIGQPTRGQRTRSHFRHGRSVGVQKSKIAKAAAPAKPAKAEKK